MANNKPKTIHRKQLFGGVKTAQEVHWEAWPHARCPCGLAPAVRALSFAPIFDLLEKDPLLLRQLSDQNGGTPPILELKYGTFVRIGEIFACSICRPALEKAMAKLPSWVLVEFDAGPGPDRPVIQVA